MSSFESAVIQHLNACVLEDKQVYLPKYQISQDVFPKVKRALEGIGGQWKKTAQAFVFKTDPAEHSDRIRKGEKLDLIRSRKKATQFFETTKLVLEEIEQYIHISRGMRVLEPHAGQGAIAQYLLNLFNKNDWKLDCCELDQENRSVLQAQGLNLVGDDFLMMAKPERGYHLIVANPPFTGGQDVTHFMKMYEMLAPGGRVVSVMSRTAVEGRTEKSRELLNFLGYFFFSVVDLPNGAFRDSGTSVTTSLLILDKPLDEEY